MTTKKIEVSVDFMKAVVDCCTINYGEEEDVDSVAHSAFHHLKKGKIKPYCKFESFEDYIDKRNDA